MQTSPGGAWLTSWEVWVTSGRSASNTERFRGNRLVGRRIVNRRQARNLVGGDARAGSQNQNGRDHKGLEKSGDRHLSLLFVPVRSALTGESYDSEGLVIIRIIDDML